LVRVRGRLDQVSQTSQGNGDFMTGLAEPLGGHPLTRRFRKALVRGLERGEDLTGIFVLLVEMLSVLDPHAYHDAPFGCGYALPSANTSSIAALHWIEHGHASRSAYNNLHEDTPATLGMMMPAVAQPTCADDRVANFSPVKAVLGGKLPRRCIADDESGYPQ
jgi:hypothetical protein